MEQDRDYVLGTDPGEIDRLGLQHRVWRPRMLDACRRAGIGPGRTVLDVGAGPGFAATDIAEIVGPAGCVIAVERSRRFLDALAERAECLGLANLRLLEADVTEGGLGEAVADSAWCRWVLSFVANPSGTVSHIAAALRPGGTAIFHEYADYASWRTMPPSPEIERFVRLAMQSWRDTGGEPDIALRLPMWLEAEGLEIVSVRPLVEIVGREDLAWQWPAAFLASGANRLAELGYVDGEEAERLAGALERMPQGTRMMTPLVAEIIARKRG
ncbi:MAG TPA: methyltransferase domain-containing protein [Allosphingosinicella sp.]|jgi:SAM-dependent methyltransferase|nr:methyltransferase domain-containing protein [Allosphingosinicella sp.]